MMLNHMGRRPKRVAVATGEVLRLLRRNMADPTAEQDLQRKYQGHPKPSQQLLWRRQLGVRLLVVGRSLASLHQLPCHRLMKQTPPVEQQLAMMSLGPWYLRALKPCDRGVRPIVEPPQSGVQRLAATTRTTAAGAPAYVPGLLARPMRTMSRRISEELQRPLGWCVSPTLTPSQTASSSRCHGIPVATC